MARLFAVASFYCLVFHLIFFPLLSHSQSTQQEYQYDTLGRLTQVKENNSIKVGYCYDKAGNRTAVSAGSGGGNNCPTGNEPPPGPTGLRYSTHAGNGYVVNWNPSPGATYYRLRFGSSTMYTVQGGNTNQFSTAANTASNPPVYIQACNASACSAYVYF